MKKTLWMAGMFAACAARALDFTGLGFAGRNGEIGVSTRTEADGKVTVTGLTFRDGGGHDSFFWGGMTPCNTWCAQGNVKDLALAVDRPNEKVVVTGTFARGEKNPELPFYQCLSRSADGRRARLEIRLGDGKTPAKGFRLNLGGSFGGRLFGEDRERRIVVDGEEVDLSFVGEKERTGKRFSYWDGSNAKELVFDMAADRSILAFRLPVGTVMSAAQNWEKPQARYDRTDFGFGFTPDAHVVLEIDFDRTPSASKKGYIVRGVNFAPAGFRMPDFSRSRNLLLNGSFEEGLYLWQPRSCGQAKDDPHPEDYAYQIDEKEACDGRRSFRQRVYPGHFNALCTFGIPVTPRQTYTLSFWAKTDLPAGAGLYWTGWTQAFGPYVSAGDMGKLTKEWKRYTKTYVAPNKFLSCSLVPTGVGQEGHIWIDRVQLVDGEEKNDIPVADPGFVLETDHPMFWCEPGEKLGARLRFQSAKGGTAKVAWNVKDVFRRVLRTGSFTLAVPAGHAAVRQPIPELEGLDSGSYALEATVEGFGSATTRHFRFLVMKKLPHAFKNRTLFNGFLNPYCVETVSRILPFWADAGVGSCVMFAPPEREIYARYLKPLNIVPCGCLFSCDRSKFGQELFDGKYNLARTKSNGLQTVPDSARDTFFDFGARTQKRYPYIDFWKTVNEPMYSDEDVRHAARVLRWVAEGVRSVNPKAKIFTPDPGALDENVRKLWEGGCRGYCDYPAVHPYREHPEDPDLDANIQMLREWFPNEKVFFTEGNFFTCLELPENSCTAIGHGKALGSGDANRIGQLTPDIGLGELAGTAHAMRYRLQVLKHADFVLWDNDWGLNEGTESFLGLDMIPTARIFAVNTLGKLLGDATFVSDILFGEPIRCYLFEDGEKRPVAVIWNYHKEIFVKPHLVSSLDWKGMTEKTELFNLVGAREAVPADGLVPVTGAPLFIRGAAGRTAALKKALESLDMVGGEVPDFRVDKCVENGAVKLTLVNIRARENRGHLKLRQNGRVVREADVVLAPQAKHAVLLSFAGQFDRTCHTLAFEFQPVGKAKLVKEFTFDCFCAKEMPRGTKPDGDLAKWSDAPAIRLPTYADLQPPAKSKYFAAPLFRKGDADLSATVKAKWAADGIYLLIDVTDDVYAPFTGPMRCSYEGDGVQLYIDTFGDGVNAVRDQYDPDDQVYMLRSLDGKTIECWREREPWKQYAFTKKGPEPRIGGIFRKTEKGWRMDVKLPFEALPPIVLEKGRAIGLSVLVNDHDGDYRKRACYLSTGQEPMNRPRTWPLMILSSSVPKSEVKTPLWPSLERMPDRQPHQYAAMGEDAWAPGTWGQKFKPGFRREDHAMPHLDWCKPPAKPNGSCVILISGGGYGALSDAQFVRNWDKFFTGIGCQCVKLIYRVPRAEGIPFYKTAWEDGQRAVRLVRRAAAARGFDPERIAAIGCSAGSHLTTLLATSALTPTYAPVDDLDRTVPCHLNLAITGAIAYGMTDGLTWENTRGGDAPDVTLSDVFKFDAKTCPMCMLQGGRDPYSPLGSTHVYRRLHAMKIPAELHLFADREHNFWGWYAGETWATAYDNWFGRVHEFMVQLGFTGPVPPEERIGLRFGKDVPCAYAKEDVWPKNRKPPDVQTNQVLPYLEWYVPSNLTTRAIQIMFSGDGYANNSPERFEVVPARRYLNGKGMTVVTLRYRLPRPLTVPDYVTAWQDLQRTIRIVRAGAAARGLDPNRIGVMGASAGGHLALMGATSSRHASYRPMDDLDKLPCNVQWAVAVCPGYLDTKSGRPNREFAFDVDTCPTLFIHGDADGADSIGSVIVWEQMRRMGVQGDLHTLAKRAHRFMAESSPGTGSYTYLDRIWEFFNHKGINKR